MWHLVCGWSEVLLPSPVGKLSHVVISAKRRDADKFVLFERFLLVTVFILTKGYFMADLLDVCLFGPGSTGSSLENSHA